MLDVLEASLPEQQALPQTKLQLAQAATIVAQTLSLSSSGVGDAAGTEARSNLRHPAFPLTGLAPPPTPGVCHSRD